MVTHNQRRLQHKETWVGWLVGWLEFNGAFNTM